jgi:starch synthase (maltosyl-transferring)
VLDGAIDAAADLDRPVGARLAALQAPELTELLEANPLRELVTVEGPYPAYADRPLALCGSWYEFFPRSEGATVDEATGRVTSGNFRTAAKRLDAVAAMGFDVIYLPPIHPIGRKNRKGRNNTLEAGSGDPGSPWAIGASEGGHDAVHPELGTEDDLRSLTEAAETLGIDIALDFAIQASADHPWLEEHPEWFHRRPDGTLKYAENPPKRYQDIYNFNWDSPDWRALWEALLEVILKWVDLGVNVFRVDNPHTKPFEFWAWLIAEVHKRNRDVVFLAEAFTRRAVMRHLAKLGFSQSYTYFTWKNSRWDLTEYVSELAYSGEQEYFRPNFFANTPDILHAYLQHGGPAAFEARLVLAGTLSPSYGIYSGYEHFENIPVREGSEEYLDSEKYEAKQRALDGPLLPAIQRLNEARRDNPALHHLDNVWFLETENDALVAYAKRTGGNIVIAVVNIDPHQAQEGIAIVPAELGTPPAFFVHDLLSDEHFQWRIGRNYVRLEPGINQAHLLRVEA